MKILTLPHNVCGYKYNSSKLLLLECLHKNTDFILLYLDEFMDLCACDKSNDICAHNECISCQDRKLFDMNVADRIRDMDKEVQWYKWKEDSGCYLSKCLQSRTLECAIDTTGDNLRHLNIVVFT